MCVALHLAMALLLMIGRGYVQGQAAENENDPCQGYQTLSDGDTWWRVPGSSATTDHCDNALASAWYTFRIDKEPALIPTQCVQDNTCGTQLSMHVDLAGQDLQSVAEGSEVSAWLCGSFNVLGALDCCVLRRPLTIRRCEQSLFIYHLKPLTHGCPMAICLQKQSQVVPELYLAKTGDVPHSLLPPNVTEPLDAESYTFHEICPEGQEMCQDGTCGLCTTPATTTSSTSLSTLSTTSSTLSTTSSTLSTTSSTLSTTNQEIILTLSALLSTSSPLTSTPTLTPTDLSTSETLNPDDVSTQDILTLGNNTLQSNDTEVTSNNSSNLNATDWEAINSTAREVDQSFNATAENRGVITTTGDQTVHNVSVTIDGMTASPGNDTAAAEIESTSKEDSIVQTVTGTEATRSHGSQTSTPPGSHSTARSQSSGTQAEDTHVDTWTENPAVGATSSFARSTVPADDVISVPYTPVAVNQSICFVLRGDYKEEEFRHALLTFLGSQSELQQPGIREHPSQFWHHTNITAESDAPGSTTVRALVFYSSNNEPIPGDILLKTIKESNFAQSIRNQTRVRVSAVCACSEDCQRLVTGLSAGETEEGHKSLFERNQAVFITIISLASLCLLALLLVALVLRCRRQGTWVLAPDHEEKSAEALEVDSPMTDAQIVQSETEHGTATAANGQGPGTQDDLLPADADNGWVVPLDQAPPPDLNALACKTEDTRF